MEQKYDQWRYVSIVTSLCSYDFILSKIEDSIDLIISVAEAINKINEFDHRKKVNKVLKSKANFDSSTVQGKIQLSMKTKFDAELIKKENEAMKAKMENLKMYSNISLLKFEMTRRKIASYAEDHGYTVCQLFMVSIFYTVCDTEYETDIIKNEKLEKILGIMKSHCKLKGLIEILDMTELNNVRKNIHLYRLREIKNLSETERLSQLK